MPALRVKFGARVSVAALGAVLMMAVSGAPARAQFFGYWGAPPQAANGMPAPVLFQRLQARGFQIVAPLERNGGVYLADVRDRYGHRRRLVVDAYSGAILQTFAYGPPRPPAGIPSPRPYPGPAYASRYAPQSLPSGESPSYAPPGARLGAGPYAPPREEKPRRPPHKIARREETPSKSERVRPTVQPSQATREPNLPAAGPSRTNAAPAAGAPAAHREAQVGGGSVGGGPAAAVSAGPKPAAGARPAALSPSGAKPQSQPGYANGVPINPLD